MATDYISREAAIVEIKRFIGYLDEDMIERLQVAIRRIPAADVRPVVHDHWEWDENGMDFGLGAWKCSECKAVPQTWWNTARANPLRCGGSRFCGDCGADMRKVVEIDQFKEGE